MTDEERRRLNKFGMGGDPNIEYAGENDQEFVLPKINAPVGQAETKQPVLTDVKTATPTTQDETTDLADQYTAAVKQNEKDWQDYVLGVAERNRKQQEEMRQQERADRMAGTATGLTEMAANIANLLTVGQGHATPQQYHNFSLDWMRKADQDMRERRHSNNNMQAQMERLNYQIQQVKNADRLSDIKLRIEAERQAQQQAEAQRQAEEKEKQRLAQQKETRDASMLKSGFVPDENEPTGYRFDPNLAQQMADAKRAPKGRATTSARDYGLRNDGTKKGNGYFGPLKAADGSVATEYSIGVDFDGKETEIPTLVPTLTQDEVDLMLNDIIPNKKPVPDAIVQKAVDHAKKRMAEGKSAFADESSGKGNAAAGQQANQQAKPKSLAEELRSKKSAAAGAPAAGTGKKANGGGFFDPAYRMPHTEEEWNKKAQVFGWESKEDGTGVQPRKQKKTKN